jgi:hypothetical protein
MGIALGQIGLDAETFYQLTPEEFEEVYERWAEARDSEFKNKWHQTRKICFWAAGPYMKKGSTEQSVMRFPWEKRNKTKTRITAKQDKERLEELRQRYGDQIPIHS